MRASIVIAASLAGLIGGAVSARAADLPVEPSDGGYGVCCGEVYGPIPQVVIYDNEPGVLVRRWWLPPWRNRHYYPHSGAYLKKRSSDLGKRRRASRVMLRPAPRYYRYWTNPRADAEPLIGPDVVPLPPRPRPYAYRQSPPLAAAP